MNQLFYQDNRLDKNVYALKACRNTSLCLLITNNPSFINNLVNLTNITSTMISDWRLALNKFIITLQIISAIIIFFRNLLVISAVATTKELSRVTDLYIVSLAVADILVAVLILPLFIIRQNVGYWPYKSHELCSIWLNFNICLSLASIFNLCCISVDRYVAINYPIKYFSKRNRHTALAMISCAWALSLLATLPPLFGDQHHTGIRCCYIRSDMGYRFLTGTIAFIIPFLLIGFIYTRIFWVIRRRLNKMKDGKFSSFLKKHENQSITYVFNQNNFYKHLLRGMINYFTLGRLKRYWLCTLNECHPKSCAVYNFNKKHRKGTINKLPRQITSVSVFNNRSVQSDPEKVCAKSDEMHRSVKVISYLVMFEEHTQYTGICSPQTINEKENKFWTDSLQIDNKVLDITVKDQLTDNHLFSTSEKQSLQTKSKDSNMHINTHYYRRGRLTFTREQKTVKTVAAIVCCFILCWLPFAILYLFEGMCECLLSENIYMATGWAAYLNSMCNPFIYAICNKQYSKAFKRLLQIEK
ncbi:Octopamine receptor [Schistosoma japonicum]|uniref:Octopamine receptor n=1 Tax=Schistosoma japonicum TaxID=6182 RepID=A0A4Z2DNW0_SCHJA|nr:Octopamine receptor [Schistosoma japonicum]